nr:MAG TPA: hypothetical protein [Caudoviricetes sp.]
MIIQLYHVITWESSGIWIFYKFVASADTGRCYFIA